MGILGFGGDISQESRVNVIKISGLLNRITSVQVCDATEVK
jgi:hypothetical protein